MLSRITIAAAAAALALATLTSCSAGAQESEATQQSAPSSSSPDSAPSAGADDVALSTADSPLGTIVVDGDGRAVYQFDTDTQNGDSSSCTGQCIANWPAVPGSDAPELDGVTGTVGTITGTDGEPQLTLNGWPLYYFAGDQAAGDVNGQGLMGTWWVLDPAGERITDDAPASDGAGGY